VRLGDYITRNGITVPEFARSIGVSPSSVWRWIETPAPGDRVYRPNWDALKRIEAETGGAVMPNDFLHLDPDPDDPPQSGGRGGVSGDPPPGVECAAA
jgi:hypothetical protein